MQPARMSLLSPSRTHHVYFLYLLFYHIIFGLILFYFSGLSIFIVEIIFYFVFFVYVFLPNASRAVRDSHAEQHRENNNQVIPKRRSHKKKRKCCGKREREIKTGRKVY